jgi:aconitase B
MENGFLYKSARQDSKNMEQVLKDALACTTPVVQESVRESVDESSVHIQQMVQDSIQDSTAALLRMITNPSKEHAGEIATIVKDHLAPYFETMAQAWPELW